MFVHVHASINSETKSQERETRQVCRRHAAIEKLLNCCELLQNTDKTQHVNRPAELWANNYNATWMDGWMYGPLGCGRATVDTVAVAVTVAVTGRYSGWMGYKSKCDNGQRHREVYITLPIKRSDTNVSLVSF